MDKQVESKPYSFEEMLDISSEQEFDSATWAGEDFDGVESIDFINTSDATDEGYVAITYY